MMKLLRESETEPENLTPKWYMPLCVRRFLDSEPQQSKKIYPHIHVQLRSK